MSPSVAHCNFKCVFCWRPVELTQTEPIAGDVDGPDQVIADSVTAQRRLVSGFGGVPDLVERKKFEEALEPRHVAISLAGEPTLYSSPTAPIHPPWEICPMSPPSSTFRFLLPIDPPT
jgi:tRNA wybutosine-synthesizing protein 1